MRILHVIDTLDPNAGGPPAVALRLAAAQHTLGHEVTIVSNPAPGAEARIAKSLRPVPGIQGVECVTVPNAPGAVERLFGGAARGWFDANVERFDVLHLHSVWDTILRVAGASAHEHGVPYAVTPHGVLDPWCLRSTLAKEVKKRIALAVAYKPMLDRAAFLHTLNRDERELLRPLRLAPPAEVIPNGVFIEEFSDLPPKGSFFEAHPELEHRPYVLFLSRVHHKKGLDYLIDAFAIVHRARPDVRLVVAGPDDGALEPALEQANRLGVGGAVHAIGPVYARDKLGALVDASVFCLSSRQEGFSMAVTEALACGLPAVISDQCHFPEVAESGAGRVVPLNAGEVARGLLAVLADESKRIVMGRAGRTLVESRFTWPRIAVMTIDAYARHAVPTRAAAGLDP